MSRRHRRCMEWRSLFASFIRHFRLIVFASKVIKNLYATPPSLFVPSAPPWHCVYLRPSVTPCAVSIARQPPWLHAPLLPIIALYLIILRPLRDSVYRFYCQTAPWLHAPLLPIIALYLIILRPSVTPCDVSIAKQPLGSMPLCCLS